MARIYRLPQPDPTALPEGVGLAIDGSVWSAPGVLARFLPLPDAVIALLYQPAPLTTQFPGGTLGASLVAGVMGGVDTWYKITSFTHDGPDMAEQGAIDADVTLTWALNFDESEVDSYTLDGPGGLVTLPGNILTTTLTGVNINSTGTWTLTAHIPFGSVIAKCTYYFGLNVYVGRGHSAVLTEVELEALVATVAVAVPNRFEFGVGSVDNEYLWVCFPEEFGGMPLFIDERTSLPVEFLDMTDLGITNANGIGRVYHRFRSLNGLSGDMILRAV